MTIREAGTGDLPGILEIHNEAIANTTAIWDEREVDLNDRRRWFEGRHVSKLPVLVADVDGVVAGYASYGPWRPKSGYRRTMEVSVYVHPDYQRQGLGDALLGALVDHAQESGMVRCLVAGVEATNETSIALHAKHGFVEVGRLPEVGFKFKKWLDLVYLQRMLEI
ncbi:MAG: acetyltransferase [Aeromicrobium sp.]|nr:acetyltransferase [Aeromicrobium sp.]